MKLIYINNNYLIKIRINNLYKKFQEINKYINLNNYNLYYLNNKFYFFVKKEIHNNNKN